MAITSRLLCSIALLLALAACDQRVPTAPLALAGPRRALDFDTAQLSRAGYEMVTILNVPVKLDDASVSWTSTGVTLADGEYAYLVPEGAVSFALNDTGWKICAREYQWYCGKVSGVAGPYGGVGGPSGAYDAELRLFYRVNGSGGHEQILAFPASPRGPGTIEIMRNGARDPWNFSGTQTVQIWRMRGAQPPPQQEPKIALACTPNPVIRGQEVTCTASKDPASAPGELKITGWSFGGRPRTDGDVTSTEWGGIIVNDGNVEVRGTIDGGPELRDDQTIRVERRRWPVMQFPVPQHVVGVDETYMADYPPAGLAYGRFRPMWPDFTMLDARVIEAGPNTGLWFLPSPVSLPQPQAIVHPALYVSALPAPLGPGSPGHSQWLQWYNDQNGHPAGTCRAPDVAQFRINVEVHEGATGSSNSHWGVGNGTLSSSKLHEKFESLTSDQSADDLRFRANDTWQDWLAGPYRNSQRQFDRSDYPNVFNLGCSLDINPGDS